MRSCCSAIDFAPEILSKYSSAAATSTVVQATILIVNISER